ncbi:MAG: BACON domain-containing protein [bacterium]|nr:BACON domain-containing protein [bacterium]
MKNHLTYLIVLLAVFIFLPHALEAQAVMSLNRELLYYGADSNGNVTPPQSVIIGSSGGTFDWTATPNESWISCTPTSGTDSGEIAVSVSPTGLSIGTHTGTVTIDAPGATVSPRTLSITLNIYSAGQTALPFGDYAEPITNSEVSGSIAVTGWVLDDLGVQQVQLFSTHHETTTRSYIGDGIFADGARWDVEYEYPQLPLAYRAGWGYMLLTNFLPGGDGIHTLEAVAIDMEGNSYLMGTKVITVNNADATAPFGAIDSPAQGGFASGTNFRNNGWALTPQPNTIATDGSTIQMWMDGVPWGTVVYGLNRPDVAALFPGYNNTGGAGGYYEIDTTYYANHLHTISWGVRDNNGNESGVGSRYFRILNDTSPYLHPGLRNSHQRSKRMARYNASSRAMRPHSKLKKLPRHKMNRLKVRTGYNATTPPRPLTPTKTAPDTGKKANRNETNPHRPENENVVTLKGLKPMAIHLGGPVEAGYLNTPSRLVSLPVGSTLDTGKGIFYWQPGPGFMGKYPLVFVVKGSDGRKYREDVVVNIVPGNTRGK